MAQQYFNFIIRNACTYHQIYYLENIYYKDFTVIIVTKRRYSNLHHIEAQAFPFVAFTIVYKFNLHKDLAFQISRSLFYPILSCPF